MSPVSVGGSWGVKYWVVAVEIAPNEGRGHDGLFKHFFKVELAVAGFVYIVYL